MALFSFERTSSPKAACAQQQRPTSPSSNTTATSTDSTTSSYKRAFASSDSSSSIPELPPTVAWLEHTTLDMSATVSKSFANCSTEFTLKVTYFDAAIQQSALTWRVNRSFDEYVEFQQRLLKTLALGHACSAECRWLHSFVKNYFPKKARFFGNCSTRTTNVRREKLARCLSVLKASLLNRGNHGCAIVALQLAGEFDTFIHGNNRFAAITADVVRRRSRAGSMLSVDDDCDSDQLEKLRRHSVSSNASSTSTDAADHEQQHIADLVNVCDLCDNSLDEAPDTSLATLNAIVNSRSSSRSIDSVDSSVVSNVFSCHTTTLSCGHQFHDECVLPELAALGYCCPSCNAPQNI